MLTRLGQVLHSLEPDESVLNEKVVELQKAIDEKLTALRTALTALDELKTRDRTGRSPYLQDEYTVHIETIETVGTYCAVELMPALERLRRVFNGRPEAEKLDKMLQEVLEARDPADLRAESRREERGPTGTSSAQISRTKREVTDAEPEEPVAVAVSPILLDHLQAHQERLGDYIQGYIRCQALSARCDEARSIFEEARAKGLKTTDWERVRKFLNDMLGMVTGLGPAFRGDVPDFKEPVTSMDNAVRDARGVVRTATGVPAQGDPDEMAGALTRHLIDMRNALDDIATVCPPKADKTLGELRDVINQIFGQIERQREARQRSTERTGDSASKFRQQVLAKTDSIVGKGV